MMEMPQMTQLFPFSKPTYCDELGLEQVRSCSPLWCQISDKPHQTLPLSQQTWCPILDFQEPQTATVNNKNKIYCSTEILKELVIGCRQQLPGVVITIQLWSVKKGTWNHFTTTMSVLLVSLKQNYWVSLNISLHVSHIYPTNFTSFLHILFLLIPFLTVNL